MQNSDSGVFFFFHLSILIRSSLMLRGRYMLSILANPTLGATTHIHDGRPGILGLASNAYWLLLAIVENTPQ